MYIDITYNIGTTSGIVDRFSQDLYTKNKHILLIGGRIAFWFSGFFAATDGFLWIDWMPGVFSLGFM